MSFSECRSAYEKYVGENRKPDVPMSYWELWQTAWHQGDKWRKKKEKKKSKGFTKPA